MKISLFFLVCIIVSLQQAIWTGKGGWQDLTSVKMELVKLEKINKNLQIRNDAIKEEIDDLKSGGDAIIETARRDLWFIHKDEVYYKIID